MGKVLVTGGFGFVGRHVIAGLIKEGLDIIVADTVIPELIPQGVQAEQMDITDEDQVIRVFGKYGEALDCVIHLAAHANLAESNNSALLDGKVNALGTRHVVNAATNAGAKRIIYMSSAAVYGSPSNPDVPIRESTNPKPESMYGLSKLLGEFFVVDAMIDNVILRGSNIYGPGQREDGGLIPRFFAAIKNGKSPVLRGNGSCVRDFLYVEDVAEAIFLSLSCSPGVYNVGSGKGHSVEEVWDLVSESCGRRGYQIPEPEYAPMKEGEVQIILLSNEKARRALNWEPAMGLEEGIERTLDYSTVRV